MADTLIEGMARTLWLMAYADTYDQLAERSYNGEASEHIAHAGPGEDWADHAPATPDAARMLAWRLVGRFEEANQAPMSRLIDYALSSVPEAERDEGKLGHCLVMRALGTGVAWEDDHPDWGCVYPQADCFYYDLQGAVEASFTEQIETGRAKEVGLL